jgi:hypothetical protein
MKTREIEANTQTQVRKEIANQHQYGWEPVGEPFLEGRVYKAVLKKMSFAKIMLTVW